MARLKGGHKMNNTKQAERDLFFVVDSKNFDIKSSLLCIDILPINKFRGITVRFGKKFSKIQDYICNIENYLQDINHFEYLKQYLSNKQIEYLKKYSYDFDLYFLLKDLRILKNPNFLLHRVNIENAKSQCKIIGLLCGYWQDYKKDELTYIIQEHKAYYNYIENVVRGRLIVTSPFSFVNRIKLNELFNVFFDIGKKIANNEMSFQDVINSEIMEQLEKRCSELITKIKTYKIIYNFRGDDTKCNLTA